MTDSEWDDMIDREMRFAKATANKIGRPCSVILSKPGAPVMTVAYVVPEQMEQSLCLGKAGTKWFQSLKVHAPWWRGLARWMGFATMLTLAGCTDDEGSRRALESNGFTDIQLTGYELVGCGNDDQFSTGFTAKNSQGKRVSGVVCCGWWKNCTVRF